MVPLARIAVDFPLERHVLLVAEDVQGTDRRLRIAPAQKRRDEGAPGGGRRDGVGLNPPCREHRGAQLVRRADDGEIDRIAQHTVAGAGTPNEVIRQV
jgi:hypothetical protein